MYRFRPRISLLSALLLLTIVAMAIVIVQLWREVGPLRSEVRELRNEVGLLSIEDKSKLHAIEVRTNQDLFWKWRIWVPEGMKAKLKFFCGHAPLKGYPAATAVKDQLRSGEQWVSISFQKITGTDDWRCVLQDFGSTMYLPIPKSDRWFVGPQADWYCEGVGTKSKVDDDEDGPKTFFAATSADSPHA
jgi:hypothetical protein